MKREKDLTVQTRPIVHLKCLKGRKNCYKPHQTRDHQRKISLPTLPCPALLSVEKTRWRNTHAQHLTKPRHPAESSAAPAHHHPHRAG